LQRHSGQGQHRSRYPRERFERTTTVPDRPRDSGRQIRDRRRPSPRGRYEPQAPSGYQMLSRHSPPPRLTGPRTANSNKRSYAQRPAKDCRCRPQSGRQDRYPLILLVLPLSLLLSRKIWLTKKRNLHRTKRANQKVPPKSRRNPQPTKARRLKSQKRLPRKQQHPLRELLLAPLPKVPSRLMVQHPSQPRPLQPSCWLTIWPARRSSRPKVRK